MFGMALILITGYFLAKWMENPSIEFIALMLAIFSGVPYLLIKANSKSIKNKNNF
jgi:hypothetical protein